jgi:hypothetical protein
MIERGFCRLKQWRGLATRYDKLAIVYHAAVVLHAATAWHRDLQDTPWAAAFDAELNVSAGEPVHGDIVGLRQFLRRPVRALREGLGRRDPGAHRHADQAPELAARIVRPRSAIFSGSRAVRRLMGMPDQRRALAVRSTNGVGSE